MVRIRVTFDQLWLSIQLNGIISSYAWQIIEYLIFSAQANVAKDKNDRERRYIFYDVNPGEGFNLRRDVFMRVAVFVKNLNLKSKSYQYTLVLPPWGRLYHWQSRHLGEQVR